MDCLPYKWSKYYISFRFGLEDSRLHLDETQLERQQKMFSHRWHSVELKKIYLRICRTGEMDLRRILQC